MKYTAIILTAAALILGLSFCAKKEKSGEEKAGAVTRVCEPGEFGISRRMWSDSVPPRERVRVALAVKDADIELAGGELATVETSKGNFKMRLYSKDSPKTVKNFIRLAECGFYDGLIWHRYEPEFVIQGGDPLGTGTGNAGYWIPFEDSRRKHVPGAVGMASRQRRDSTSSQFYITLATKPSLDKGYVVFGKVTQGMNVVTRLRKGDTIRTIDVTVDTLK